ncbi:Kelch repeat protein [Parvibaculum lavamentivorans DS-1]|uniref:Kelch repeat protein n=1 Tax=Parvibaculum lavamentivorans (strain DS-1 / DSM 13023 / NCIMB 13966) TaxID=402881 RepID=A7HWV4_PARL1|nr:kelch repeat-containing protein [Parvibaculum lavamentivorans]ABS64387.1 Kelch repeat protein [Parvibaculum lavamentivorans DS-1]
MSSGCHSNRVLALVFLCLLAPGAAAAESWRDGSPMTTGRAFAGGALVGNELYVIGGDSTSGPRNVAEIYDMRGDIWRASPGLPVGLQQFGIAELNGKLYVSGGYEAPQAGRPEFGAFGEILPPTTEGGDTAQTWIYDPQIGTWVNGPQLPAARAGHGAAVVDGKIYTLGGRGSDAQRVLVYDPGSNRWSATGEAMPAPRVAAATVAVGDRIYVIGGLSNGVATARVDIFDTASGRWQSGPQLPEARSGHVAALVGGKLHVTGGEQRRPPRTFGDHFILDAEAGSWSRAVPMPNPRHGAVAAAVDGKFVVVGGSPGAGVYTVFTESDVVDIYSAD